MSVVDNFFDFLIGVSFPFVDESLLELPDLLEFVPVLFFDFFFVFLELVHDNSVGLFVLGDVFDGLVEEVELKFCLLFECVLLLVVFGVDLLY